MPLGQVLKDELMVARRKHSEFAGEGAPQGGRGSDLGLGQNGGEPSADFLKVGGQPGAEFLQGGGGNDGKGLAADEGGKVAAIDEKDRQFGGTAILGAEGDRIGGGVQNRESLAQEAAPGFVAWGGAFGMELQAGSDFSGVIIPERIVGKERESESLVKRGDPSVG